MAEDDGQAMENDVYVHTLPHLDTLSLQREIPISTNPRRVWSQEIERASPLGCGMPFSDMSRMVRKLL